ncbi:hypothetical protein KM043_017509 [Ampulex compressa]|nr:hypothetical protein KM043_017509 [Ampulex compressa]
MRVSGTYQCKFSKGITIETMSRIRRLSIRGIRNFGDDNEETIIRFTRPLTLILGPNGTGKTTVIESLKFATTGEFPPGTNRGKSFIHDPVLSTTSSVRGVVKAEIVDTYGNRYIICRTIESSRSNTAVKFKTLDSALTRISKDTKEKVSITNRCANVDTELTLAMGVSKPILNYVIFCHQEDLNWPLEDGKKLKEKFDDIFDSARYNKALDTITKQCKEIQEDIRVLKVQKDSLYNTVGEVEDKETRLADYKRRLATTNEKMEEIDRELQPLKQKLRKIEKLDSEYNELITQEEKKQMEYNISKQQLTKLKENINDIFKGTMAELNAHIVSYDDVLMKKSIEITELKEKLNDITKEEARIATVLGEENITVGTLRQQIQDHDKKLQLRNRVLNEALTASDLDTTDAYVSEIEVLAFTKRLEEKMCDLEHTVEENRIKREQEEKEMQKKVDALLTERSKIDSEKNLKENEVLETREEINKIRSQVMQLGTAENKLTSIESKIGDAKVKVDKLSKAMDVDAVKSEVQEKIKLRTEMESKLNKIEKHIELMHKQSSLQAELELNKSSLGSKEVEIKKLKNKHENNVKMLLNAEELPQDKLKDRLDSVQHKLMDQMKQLTQQIQGQERNLTTLETTLARDKQEIVKKMKELQADKDKILSICDYNNFSESLQLQSCIVKDLQNKRGLYAHEAVAYKEYVKQLKQPNPCCPLCHRHFTKEDSVEGLVKEMQSKTENARQLEQCEEELRLQQEKHDKMLQLVPIVEKVRHLENVELKKLEQNYDRLEKNVTKARITLEDLEAKKVEPEKKLARYKEIIGDIMLWDRNNGEVKQLKEVVESFQNRLTNAGIKSDLSLEESQKQKETLKVALKDIRNEIETLQTKINTHNEKLQDARSAYNVLHETQLKILANTQKLKQLKDKQNELYSREVSLGESVKVLKQRLNVAENELDAGVHQLEKRKKENREKQEVDRRLVAESSRLLSELRTLQKEVDSFTSRKIPEALARAQNKIENYEKSLNEYICDRAKIEETMCNLKDDISQQEMRKRELLDNVTLRKVQDATRDLEHQCAVLQEKIKSMNHDRIVDEWKQLQKRETNLLREKNLAEGNQQELEKAVQQYTDELKKDVYRQARRNYKHKCIELTVKEEIILNLKAYSKVLDSAMIEYHEERMATVNKIMKRLWKLVYTGTDTTSIQISTEATVGVGSSKRTYNYKLVQTKHGHDMDMRGRCSAGQRVLASIIIRLALAETFCKDCGILALDEPTTNLDEENSNSLADALSTVVKIRSQHQKNFQLIVISHDEKFLLKLATLNNNRGFYELYRKPNGLTAVKHCLVEGENSSLLDAVKEEIYLSSDEEPQRQPGRKQQGNAGEDFTRKKKHNWDVEDEELNDDRPTKKRYVLNL